METNGDGRTLELGKIIGSIGGLVGGQETIFRKLDSIERTTSESDKQSVRFEGDIDKMKRDINGVGLKAENIRKTINEEMYKCKTEVNTKITNHTKIVISVLSLFLVFLTVWVYVLKQDTKNITASEIRNMIKTEQMKMEE